MTIIKNFQDLCDYFGADEPAGLNRRIYKDTSCGASISVRVQNPAALKVDGDSVRLHLQVRENYFVPERTEDDTDETYAKRCKDFRGLYVVSLNSEHDTIYNHGPNCYFTDTLRACHEGAFWFDELERRLHLDQLHFVCGSRDPMSFWPAEPRRRREGDIPVTIETLKAAANGHIEAVGLHNFLFIIKKPKEAPREVTVSAHVARQPNGYADLLELKEHRWGCWQQVNVFREDYDGEAWLQSVMEFFSVGTDTPFDQIMNQKWEHRDRVTVEKRSKDELVITKTFEASDKGFGWKVHSDRDDIWAHNDSELWKHITMETPLYGFTIQSIVEGSDTTVDSSEFVVPVDSQEIDDWMRHMEDETSRIWKAANTTIYELCVPRAKKAYYVRLNWGDVEWEGGQPSKVLKAKVEKFLRSYDGDHRADIAGPGFTLRLLEEDEFLY